MTLRVVLYRYKGQDIFLCSSSKIFNIIIDIERYPDFIPWCSAAYIREKTNSKILVDLLAEFCGLKGGYTSEVTFLSPSKENEGWIKAVSSRGIFKYLRNEWRFVFIDKNKTKVKFCIEFELRSSLLSLVLSSVYPHTRDRIVSAFKRRLVEVNKSYLDTTSIYK